MNLTKTFGARRDAYAKRQGEFVLGATVVRLSTDAEVWTFVRALAGRKMRLLYECLDGSIRDIIGRQGVHASKQDGEVLNVGHAMASEERLNLSFWTFAHGKKVNTGTGKGYRTIRAAGILAIRVDGTDILTDAGVAKMASLLETA